MPNVLHSVTTDQINTPDFAATTTLETITALKIYAAPATNAQTPETISVLESQ